jgi:hypothetical protein
MHYVKHFNINGVPTKQVACIELQGKPNTATEGSVGLLGIDMSSSLHEIYKCVAVNGNIYTWELFSSGLSIVSATMSGNGEKSVQFPYDNLKTPLTYVVKPGDLIIDSNGHLYQIESLDAIACNATYCGTQVVAFGKSAYDLAVQEGFEGSLEDWLATNKGEPGYTPTVGINNHWWINGQDTGVDVALKTVVTGSYIGTGTWGVDAPNVINLPRLPKMVIILPASYMISKGVVDGCDNADYYSLPLYLFKGYYTVTYKNNTSSETYHTWAQGLITTSSFDNQVSWSVSPYSPNTDSDNAALQRNTQGTRYDWIAFLGEENEEGMDYVDAALDNIISIQEELIGGEGE